MDPEFADLLPLFVSEARERVEHLAALAPRLGGDPQAAAEARRELHTLKGAGRMLRLAALAEGGGEALSAEGRWKREEGRWKKGASGNIR